MKKIKLFAATAMMAMVATAGYFGYSAYEQANMTDAERMMLSNLEALTRGENNDSNYHHKVVGCGGVRFDQWVDHCCDGYETCSSTGCSDTVIGC